MLNFCLAPRAPLFAPAVAPLVEWVVTPGLTQFPDALADMEARAEAIARGERVSDPLLVVSFRREIRYDGELETFFG